MQLGARKPHSEMFSTNDNDKTTFLHVRNKVLILSNHNAAVKHITIFKAGCTAIKQASLFIHIKIRLV